MRKLILVVAVLFCTVASASGQLARPAVIAPGKEAPVPAQTNPNPFPQPTAQPAPPLQSAQPVTVNPTVTVTPPDGGIKDWIWMTIASIFTAIFGVKVVRDGSGKLDLGATLQDPNFRLHIDQLIQKAVQSGIPGAAISTIPGVGAFEPMLRRVVEQAIDARLAANLTGIDGSSQGRSDQPIPQPHGDVVGELRQLLPALRQLLQKDAHNP